METVGRRSPRGCDTTTWAPRPIALRAGGAIRSARAAVAATLALVLLAGCSGDAASQDMVGDGAPPPRAFREVAAEAGIDHRHLKPVLDSKIANVMPWMSSVGAAVAAGDFDGDGLVDLYLTTSRKGAPNRLYRNLGDGRFADVAAAAGLADVNGEAGVSMDCAWGDYDNDGDVDLYLVRWGRDSLYRNEGDGTFAEVSEQVLRQSDGRPGAGWHNGNALVFLDYDRDGLLDVYVGNYFADHDLWNLETTRIMHDDFESARNAGRNQLFHQLPDGSFEEVAARLGVDDAGWTLAVGAADLDGDGWPDLYVANDFGPDQLFLNDRRGGFTDVTAAALGHDTKKGMNVDFGDFDGDGWLDVYVTNITTAEYLQEGNMLWRNNGPGDDGVPSFTDVSLETGTYDGGWGWGAKFFDFDHDTDLDLISVNGFITAGEGNFWYDLASWTVVGQDPADTRNWPAIGDRSFSGDERTRFWRNDGFSSFSEQAEALGLGSRYDGRGIAYLDYDDDGDLDLYVANQDQPGELFRNQLDGGGNWLLVRLVGDPAAGSNRDGIGARVTVVAGERRQVRERDGGNGFAGQSDPRLHFGLGGSTAVELVEVRWPDGGYQVLEDVPANRLLEVRQDRTAYVERVLAAPAARAAAGPAALASEAPRGARAELDASSLDDALGRLEDELRRDSARYHVVASEYRRLCAEHGVQDRAIDYFAALLDGPSPPASARIHLASAYVDKIPTCGGAAAIICKGSLAKRALDHLDRLVAEDPDSWLAHYARGINHLHWPRALRHSADAAADLERCVELQRDRERDERARAAFEGVHVALGDAYVKAGDLARARAAWRRGQRRFPDSTELAERLAIEGAAELLALVENRRSLEQPIDTDLGFFPAPG